MMQFVDLGDIGYKTLAPAPPSSFLGQKEFLGHLWNALESLLLAFLYMLDADIDVWYGM